MKRVVIIGGGFAGLAAAQVLSRARRLAIDVWLVDRRAAQQNLPLLPELVSRELDPAMFRYAYTRAARRWSFTFRRWEVTGIDTAGGRLDLGGETQSFDYLLVATGSRTHLRHLASLRQRLMVLDSVEDAVAIRRRVHDSAPRCVVVAGGSYTGVEVASALQCSLRRSGPSCRVMLLNRGERTCRSLPETMGLYIEQNLRRMGIDIRHHTTLERMDDGVAELSTGERVEGALAVWTAGVHVPGVVNGSSVDRTSDGRLVPDSALRIGERCYVAGDAAGFLKNGLPVRMSVQHAIMSGRHAARNIVRQMTGKPLKPYRPVDLGYVVPMANFRGCGTALGVHLQGRLPMLLHYGMGLYRSLGWDNRLRMIRALTRT